jgi:glucokinase
VAVGVDIGGTKIAVGLADRQGSLTQQSVAETPRPASAEAVIAVLSAGVARVLRESASRGVRVLGIGVGTAGVVNRSTGIVISSTDALIDWGGVQLRGRLQETFGLPVSIDNDVNAMAAAEARFGAGQSHTRLLVAAVGTGIGGAFVRDGVVDRGATGSAGEIGHLPIGPADGPRCGCGRFGHLEAYSSGPAMLRRYNEVPNSRPATDFRNLVDRARAGDRDAIEILGDGAATLGRALGGLANIFDPDAVVLGGGVAAAGPLFLAPLRQSFRGELLPGAARLRLRSPRFPTYGGVIGAAATIIDELLPAASKALATLGDGAT